jgi:hypothetical protein
VSRVKYELIFYIPDDDILQGRRRENLRSYTDVFTLSGIEPGHPARSPSLYRLHTCGWCGTVPEHRNCEPSAALRYAPSAACILWPQTIGIILTAE